MLRPEQMSKVSVTGSKRVMDDVIETVHDLNLLHVTDYDGAWEGFSPGDPMEGAEEASEKLVTVRSLESILDVDEDDAGPERIVTDDALESELEEVRERANELDDRRDAVESELREVEEEIEAVEPFVDLGIDLDLLSGYETLEVAVGEGRAEAVEAAVAGADGVDAYEVFAGDRTVAVFARPAADADADVLSDALVGVDFAALEVPDAEGSPENYVDELEARRRELESKLGTVENELEDLRVEAAGFILAAEEELSIEVQKREAPLSFATTKNAFVAEGWIPTERVGEFESAIAGTVGDHAEVEELERASFTAGGGHHEEAVADGGTTMADDEPPVVQDNPGPAEPFEVLVEAVNRPNYREFDPTVLVFLTFPLMFGFMIGDVGYGIVYTAIGYYLYSNYDSPGFSSMGGVTIWAGLFTILFGVLYGEFFGFHFLGEMVWGDHPPIEKGLSPATLEWAFAWLTVSVLFGVLHLDVGYALDFYENAQFHGLKEAVYESGSWLLMLNGLWVWIFSESARGTVPEFVFGIFDGEPIPLGFTGFPEAVGLAGAALFFVGLALLAVGVTEELVEFLQVLVNALSYTRIAAVLLAKAGMAFTVNLLAFGAYEHHGEFHFMTEHGPQWVVNEYGREAIMFSGLFNAGAGGVVGGIVVLVVGHLLVLALGVTSAGLQAVRLEYVEFFGKFYEGGGREYEPFGRVREFTKE